MHAISPDDDRTTIHCAVAALLREPAPDLDDEPQLLRRLHGDHFRLREIEPLLPNIRALARYARAAGLAAAFALGSIDRAAAHAVKAAPPPDFWASPAFAALAIITAGIFAIVLGIVLDFLERRNAP